MVLNNIFEYLEESLNNEKIPFGGCLEWSQSLPGHSTVTLPQIPKVANNSTAKMKQVVKVTDRVNPTTTL